MEVLQECLIAFETQQQSTANLTEKRETRAIGFDDPEVQNRLRDLGYLED